MAFNRSNFTASKLGSAMTNAAEGKTSYGSGNSGHRWFKTINGIKVFQKPKEPCKTLVNILPFQRKDGSLDFFHNVFVHKIPKTDGVGDNEYLCTKNDPICAMKVKVDVDGATWDDIKAYVPKGRTLILMNPVGTDDVCIFECATKNKGKAFPEMLNAQATAMAMDTPIIDYASLDEGKAVVLQWVEQSFNGHKYMDVGAIGFRDRTEEISDVVLNKIPDYIEMLNNVGPNDNDEMETLINGGEVAKQEAEESKQDEFEAMMVQEHTPTPKAEEKKDYGDMTLDFNQDPYTKPAPKPEASSVFACPNGFDPASEFGTHRQCMRCPHADKCEKFAG